MPTSFRHNGKPSPVLQTLLPATPYALTSSNYPSSFAGPRLDICIVHTYVCMIATHGLPNCQLLPRKIWPSTTECTLPPRRSLYRPRFSPPWIILTHHDDLFRFAGTRAVWSSEFIHPAEPFPSPPTYAAPLACRIANLNFSTEICM